MSNRERDGRDGRQEREEREERRRQAGDFRTKPRSSPGSLVILTVSAVLLVTAAATALLGGGFDSATPHGRLLGTLDAVAKAQQEYHAGTGTYAAWERTLEIDAPEQVTVHIVHSSASRWEAMVEDPTVNLSCVQRGSWEDGRHQLEKPVCYR